MMSGEEVWEKTSDLVTAVLVAFNSSAAPTVPGMAMAGRMLGGMSRSEISDVLACAATITSAVVTGVARREGVDPMDLWSELQRQFREGFGS